MNNQILLNFKLRETVNFKYFIGKSVDSFHEQLKLIYDEAIWCNNSIVVLDNLDFILENANLDNDPKLKLYCYQLIEGW
jgi:hypothetical protein